MARGHFLLPLSVGHYCCCVAIFRTVFSSLYRCCALLLSPLFSPLPRVLAHPFASLIGPQACVGSQWREHHVLARMAGGPGGGQDGELVCVRLRGAPCNVSRPLGGTCELLQ